MIRSRKSSDRRWLQGPKHRNETLQRERDRRHMGGQFESVENLPPSPGPFPQNERTGVM